MNLLYYKRHIGDYIRDTAHLSLIEHGAYARLMDVYYGREEALPEADVLRLVGARSKDEIAAVRTVLSEFWKLTSEGWIQKRCDHEIGKAREKAEKNRANGKKGGRPSKNETQSDSQSKPINNPKETHMVSDGNPNVTLSNYPTIQLSNNSHNTQSAGARPITQSKPTENPDGFRVGEGTTGKAAPPGPHHAWRDVTECDVQAYESWLHYRDEAGEPVPAAVRIQHAKFLSGKGGPEQQRAFVAKLIQLQFKRLRDPSHDGPLGNGTHPPETQLTWQPTDDEEKTHASG